MNLLRHGRRTCHARTPGVPGLRAAPHVPGAPGMSAPRIALATCAELPDLDPDDRLLPPALAALGIDAEPVALGRPACRLGRVRPRRRAQHLGLPGAPRRVPRVGRAQRRGWSTRPPVLRWTTDKRYLVELEAAGLPVVPHRVPAARATLPDSRPGRVVVKPAVGVGSVDAGRHTRSRQRRALTSPQLLAAGARRWSSRTSRRSPSAGRPR